MLAGDLEICLSALLPPARCSWELGCTRRMPLPLACPFLACKCVLSSSLSCSRSPRSPQVRWFGCSCSQVAQEEPC